MISVFDYLDYRKCLSDKAKSLKKQRAGWTLQRLAEKSFIQAPYITNVFKGRAHFSADQVFALAEVFNFSRDEADYCLQLLEYERSGNHSRKQLIKRRIDEIRRDKLKSEAHIHKDVVDIHSETFARYYARPELKIIHFFLFIPRFAEQPHLISSCLNISQEQLEKYIQDLIELEFIKKTNKGIALLRSEFHLPKESPFCEPHQLLMHYRALQHQQLLPPNKKYNFSVTFTADEKTREKIQREFLAFLSKIENYVEEAPAEQVYQIHFDLFKWSK